MTLPGAGPLADEPAPWIAAYTKPRQEKALAWDLVRRGIPYFLPLVRRVSLSGGRRRTNLYPLFPSYVFIAAADDARLNVLRTDRVLREVVAAPAEQPTLRRELADLELALRTAPDDVELSPRLIAGVRVRVVAGALKNIEGVVLQIDGRTKLWLGVSAMGSGALMEIHPDLVEPLDDLPHEADRGKIEYQVAHGKFVATTATPAVRSRRRP